MTRMVWNAPRRAAAAAAVLLACTLVAAPVSTHAAEPPPPDPKATVYAIVSPVASPVCGASGSATLLVPIVSGLIDQKLGGKAPSVGDLVLNSLGPVYVACGTLPAAPGTRCQIDDQIAGVVPDQISSLTGPTPGVLGNVTDSLAAGLSALGLPRAAALDKALKCEVPGGPEAIDPPPPVAPPPDAPTATTAALLPSVPSSGGGSSGPTGEATLPTSDTPTPVGSAPIAGAPAGSSSEPAIVRAITSRLPGGLLGLQLIVFAALVAYLASSWAASWRESRHPVPAP